MNDRDLENKRDTSGDDQADNNRPLASFILLTYNQEQFIREALEGAFSQTLSPLEIIISDDCSKDHTFEIIEEAARHYNGANKIILNRNRNNLGLGMHFNKVMEMASGDIIIPAAGDDISLPHRAEKTMEIFHNNERLTAVSLGIKRITGTREASITGEESNHSEPLKMFDLSTFIHDSHFHVNAPSRAYRKKVFDYFGPLDRSCPSEDTPMLFRSLLLGKVAYLADPGIFYRIHENNMYASRKKYFIDYEAIYKNLFSDLETAKNQYLVTQEIADITSASISKRLDRFNLNAGFGRSNFKLLYFFRNMLFSNLYSGRAKLMHFRKCL